MNSLDLAVIGNCNIAALVDRQADIVWMCFPRLDGDPVFCSLLIDQVKRQPAEGLFSIEMIGLISCDQAYLENTAILVSVLRDDKGSAIEITDFAPRFQQYDRVFRPPAIIRR